ncbi:GNAT family protein [Streptomyces sp. BE308]|uniref:GNAT family N-acetyltransferase n=1 Tax=unclassified Streptomyces TaxID=2593676 RepID=UPI00093CC32C|nr:MULTISPECIES: GNAT family protein [unclassified Streptomyces]MEE1789968.1 GNAT family protein [Streptomyces sp. BE308]OKI34246.1 GCN5 family acetyltransferase [Streptomyces sp. TSRI0281]WRZ75286.1 GNAT family N-acetyltransferase [Streptomyces sp. NBC_01237]
MFAIALDDDGAELRPLEVWRAPEFLAHMDRARDLVDPWIPFASAATDLTSARALLQRYADKQAADTGRLYGIWLDGTLVGGVLFRIFDAEAGNCEVGCWLEPAAQGRGLITRAMRHLIDWAVDERGMHRVEWDASAANTRSIAVAKRLGMTREAVLRENYLYRGTRHDSEIWAVLAPEWREQRG